MKVVKRLVVDENSDYINVMHMIKETIKNSELSNNARKSRSEYIDESIKKIAQEAFEMGLRNKD